MKRNPPRKPKPFKDCGKAIADIWLDEDKFEKNGPWFINTGFVLLDYKEAGRLSRWLVNAAEYVEYKNR